MCFKLYYSNQSFGFFPDKIRSHMFLLLKLSFNLVLVFLYFEVFSLFLLYLTDCISFYVNENLTIHYITCSLWCSKCLTLGQKIDFWVVR